MGLVLGNKTEDISIGIVVGTPDTATLSHTANNGTDKLLVVVVAYNSSNNCIGMEYNGDPMTKEGSWTMLDTGANVEYDVWYLVNPDSGSAYDIVADFDSTGTAAMAAWSFTGAEQTTPLQSLNSGAANTPHSQSITISTNSMLMGISASLWSYDVSAALTIDGTAVAFASGDLSGSISSAQFIAHVRDANLTSGSKTVIADTQADTWKADNTRVEIKEAAAPAARRRIIIV